MTTLLTVIGWFADYCISKHVMGNTGSPQQDLEKMIFWMLSDFNRSRYTLVIMAVSENIQARTPLAAHAVKVIKSVIKDPKKHNVEKYRALHLLKELLKPADRQFRDACEKIIMERLRQLALSSFGERVLLGYNSKSSVRFSRKFHRLLLECFAEWHEVFGRSHPFFAGVASELRGRKILPTSRIYYRRFTPGPARSLAAAGAGLKSARLNLIGAFELGWLRGFGPDSALDTLRRRSARFRESSRFVSAVDCAPAARKLIERELNFIDRIEQPFIEVSDDFESQLAFMHMFESTYCELFGNEEYFPDFKAFFARVEARRGRAAPGDSRIGPTMMRHDSFGPESIESAEEEPPGSESFIYSARKLSRESSDTLDQLRRTQSLASDNFLDTLSSPTRDHSLSLQSFRVLDRAREEISEPRKFQDFKGVKTLLDFQ
mgnify:CR=1 FL=1